MDTVRSSLSSSTITLLDPTVAARVAAGEVIERPASIVKELLENALDAQATSIRVEMDMGGLTRLKLTDNGCGIAADQIDLAFARHATSKIQRLEDLEALTTLGFRGEALPSIAAVATVTVQTRRAKDLTGVTAKLREGKIVDKQSIGLPFGTSIEVTDLFEELPVRRKFLKGKNSEASAIQQVVTQYAIAYPAIAITCVADGRTLFSTAGAYTLRDVIACLYGVDLAENLVDVEGERHGIRVSGLVSRIGHTRPTRAQQSFFVNKRWVRNRVLHVALEEGYHSMLMGRRHPVGVVLLDMDPATLDVNVHPAKTEIRFLYEREVFGALRHTVQAAITKPLEQPQPILPAEPAESMPTEADEQKERQQLELLALTSSEPAEVQNSIQAPLRTLPTLRVLGQATALFIIAEGPDGVYMVDQHAAHERVLYDELCNQVATQSVSVQPLLEPLLVDLDPQGMSMLTEHAALLLEFGFAAEPFGTNTGLLRAVPAMLARASIVETFQALLDDLAAGKEHEERHERSLATMACKAAVKAGQVLTMEEMRYLVQRLETTTQPRTCPHGRPTMILLTTSALERQFGRR